MTAHDGGRLVLLSVSLTMAVAVPSPAGDNAPAAWSQWGGPNQDFRAPARDLATSWPESGPEELWSRPLGEGYSAILVDGGRLYTMYRSGEKEAVVCLDAGTGETVWEHTDFSIT